MLNNFNKLTRSSTFRFLLVGGSAFIVDYGSFYALYYGLGIALYIANSFSFGLGLVISFMLNRLWTFGDRNFTKKAHHQLGFYSLLAIINLFLTNVFVGLLNHVGVGPRIGKIITIAVIAAWNFYIYHKFIFTEQKSITKDLAD